MSSALFDIKKFTLDLERGYRKMWRLYVVGERPGAIIVANLPI
jgi:hypothetical protein